MFELRSMPPSPYAYSSASDSPLPLAYIAPQPSYYNHLHYDINAFPMNHDHHQQQQHQQHTMQPPPSPSIPIDPALALYPPYYGGYQQQQHHQQHQQHQYPPSHPHPHAHAPQHLPAHLALPPNYSSPSSQGSDTIGTPPADHMYPSSGYSTGKRPASSMSTGTASAAKKQRKDDGGDDEPQSPVAEKEGKDEPKPKPTRGSRACTVCRRLKMKCVGAEQGPPCKRCQAGNHECIFEESNRGKRSSKKHEILTRSLRKMERTLDTVLRSIGNPSLASGMLSRSPSPDSANAAASSHHGTQALLARSPSPSSLGLTANGTHGPTVASSSSGMGGINPNATQTPSSQYTASPAASFSTSSHAQGHTPLVRPKQQPGSPKLHSLPDNSLNPLGLLAEASLANRRAQQQAAAAASQGSSSALGLMARPSSSAAGTPGGPAGSAKAVNGANGSTDGQAKETPKVGVASDNYFKPGPMTILPLRRLYIERQVQPEMLSYVTTEEVVALFNIFFDHIHMHCSLLDRNFHTPSLVCSRSPFLLTTICSIASKFYTEKPELHLKLTELAKRLAFSVPAKGYKSVEIVQAYLLLALWGCGAVERYEQDKTWLLLGMAIRMATDLNLHRKTAMSSSDTAEGRAREIEVHNRERTWIMCFCLDRSFSAQMGKPNSVKEDYTIRHTTEWYTSPVAIATDAGLAAYAELQRTLSRSLEFLYSATDSPSGLQVHCDYLLVIKNFETQLAAWKFQWIDSATWTGDTAAEYKRMISLFYFNYANLVLNSFGLQDALERCPVNIGHFFGRVHTSAHACATIVRDQLGPSGFMKYSPDSHFVQTSYAVLSLLKLVRPEFTAFLDNEQSTLNLVRDVADVLDNIAANPLHTPALYSGFLRALISAKLDAQPPSQHQSVNGDEPMHDGTHNQDAQHHATDLVHSASGSVSLHSGHGGVLSGTQTPNSGLFPHFGSSNGAHGPENLLHDFQFDSEMGPVADMSTFPPTMAPNPSEDTLAGALTMENILSSNFWDSMLVPGYNSMDGLSGGFVFGAGGSGLITPRFGVSPMQSGANTPGRMPGHGPITQATISAAFDSNTAGRSKLGESGLKSDS